MVLVKIHTLSAPTKIICLILPLNKNFPASSCFKKQSVDISFILRALGISFEGKGLTLTKSRQSEHIFAVTFSWFVVCINIIKNFRVFKKFF